MPVKRRPVMQRILAHIEHVDGCWEWNGLLCGDGMTPSLAVFTKGKWVNTPVRRVILMERGVDMAGKTATYTCRNKRCVNPEHIGVKDA